MTGQPVSALVRFSLSGGPAVLLGGSFGEMPVCADMDADVLLGTLFGNSSNKISCASLLERAAAGRRSFSAELALSARTGGIRSVLTDITVVRSKDGAEEAYMNLRDITAEKSELSLLEWTSAESFLLTALIDADNGAIRSSRISPGINEGRLYPRGLEPMMQNASKYAENEAEAARIIKEAALGAVKERMLRRPTCTFCFRMKNAAGAVRLMRWQFCYTDSSKKYIALSVKDITEQMNSSIDPLTKLFWREKFITEARKLLDVVKDIKYVLVRMDMDRFKAYNALYGELAGDRLLADIASALLGFREQIKPCAVGRLAADHFVACIPFDRLRFLRRFIENSFGLQEMYPEFRLTMRAGIYSIDDPRTGISIMCDRALMALRSIKAKDSVYTAWYTESMSTRIVEEQELVSEMRDAFDEDQFRICLQPQVNMATGEIIGAEVLARWAHPKKGMIPPGIFIPMLERRGHIAALDRIVWEKTCALLAKWRCEGVPAIPLSVNVSRDSLSEPHLAAALKELTGKYGLETAMLRLEVPESAFADELDKKVSAVNKLTAEGFCIEMDDFGSGCSSLCTLKDVPADRIKLNMRFFPLADSGSKGGIILNSIINMAHWLSIPILAEGVENMRQAEYLKTVGCSQGQGFLFAKPMPPEDFERLLKNGLAAPFSAAANEAASFTNDEFWDPHSQTSLIFSSFIGAAGVFEFADGAIKTTRCNSKLFSVLGISATSPAAKNIFSPEGLSPECRSAYLAAASEAADGENAECDVRLGAEFAGNGPRWLCVRMRRIAARADSCMIFALIEDITERKALEEHLRINTEELKLALEQAGLKLCIYDIPTRSLRLSDEYAKLHGVKREWENVPESTIGYVAPEDREAYADFFKSINSGDKCAAAEVRAAKADGSISWERFSSTSIFSENGAPLRAVISSTDISEEMRCKAVNERNRLLADRRGTCTFDYDVAADECIKLINDFNGEKKTLRHKKYSALLPACSVIYQDDRAAVQDALSRASAKAGSGILDYRANLWNDGFRWCRLSYVSVADQSGRVHRIVGQIEDIEDERRRRSEASNKKDKV